MQSRGDVCFPEGQVPIKLGTHEAGADSERKVKPLVASRSLSETFRHWL